MPRSSSTCSHLASRISRSRAAVSVSRRIAATEWRSNLRRRFSGFGACFALGFDSSGRLRGCERVAEAEKLVLGQIPFPSAFSILLDDLGRVAGDVHMPMSCRPAPNCRENGKRPVCLRTTLGHTGLELSTSACVIFVTRLVPSCGKMWSYKPRMRLLSNPNVQITHIAGNSVADTTVLTKSQIKFK
jgi:hypothetical protein